MVNKVVATLIVVLLSATQARADTTPPTGHVDWPSIVAVAVGQVALDGGTTVRFLHTGSCVEANTHFGPHPSDAKVMGAKLAVVGGSLLLNYLSEKHHSKTVRVIQRVENYFAAAVGARAGIHNLHHCGW